MAAHDCERDAAVDAERGERSPDHPAFDDLNGRAETLDGLVAEPGGEKYEKDCVGECGESAGAMVAVSFVAVGRTLGPAHGEPGDAESRDVGKIVHSVVEKRDAVAEDAAENFRDDKAECGDHSPRENGRFERRVNVAAV